MKKFNTFLTEMDMARNQDGNYELRIVGKLINDLTQAVTNLSAVSPEKAEYPRTLVTQLIKWYDKLKYNI